MPAFSYKEAFSRNIGWVTDDEQQILRNKKIAIGGLGGVGGSYLLALSRLGIENFHITDLDKFELTNFNRQVGATISSLGIQKTQTLTKLAKDINPNLKLEIFEHGLNDENYAHFLRGVDLFLDSLDLYSLPLKMKIFDYCFQNLIPIVTVGPIGMGASLLVFNQHSMKPSEYFGINPNMKIEEQILRFLIGVNPNLKAINYLVQKEGLDFYNKKLPSTIMGIEMCTSIACSTALKILLGRGPLVLAPNTVQFDGYTSKHYITQRPFGYKNPLQWLTLQHLKKKYLNKK